MPGKENILVDQPSHSDQVLPAKCSLLLLVFNVICKIFSHSHIDLFVRGANTKFPLYVSPVLDPMAWVPFNILGTITRLHLSPFTLLCLILSRVELLTRLSSFLFAPFWPQKKWFTGLLLLLVEES